MEPLEKPACSSAGGRAIPCDAAAVHQLDVDLELCVCSLCGLGWMRPVNKWRKMEEAFGRLQATLKNLQKSNDKMMASIQAMGDAVAKLGTL